MMADAAPTLAWEQVTAHVMRCRLPFCDVTVGVVYGDGDALVVDTGTTVTEASAVARDVASLTGCEIRHVVLTHNHFDHVLGQSVFAGSRVYCAPEVVATLADQRAVLRADAVTHGADAGEVDNALAALTPPSDSVSEGVVSIGEVSVTVLHPGRGHTDHDLIAVVADGDRTVVFCGDLVEDLIVAGFGVGLLPLGRPTGAGVTILPLHNVTLTAYAVTRKGRSAWSPLRAILDRMRPPPGEPQRRQWPRPEAHH